MKSLRGAVVAVTGASAGIGLACARAFAREGTRLAVCARRDDRLQALRAEIEGAGGECLAVVADVTRRDEVFRFVEAAAARFSGLDVLVNNAGAGIAGRVEDTPSEAFEEQMRVNYLSTV